MILPRLYLIAPVCCSRWAISVTVVRRSPSVSAMLSWVAWIDSLPAASHARSSQRLTRASALSREPFLAVAELAGAAASGRIVLAAPITLAEIESRFARHIEEEETVAFDSTSASLRARRQRRLGALTLTDQTKPVSPDLENARLLAEGIARSGVRRLPWSKAQLQLRNRVMFLHRAEGD